MARRTTRRPHHRKTTRRAPRANVRRKTVDGSWLRSLPSAVVYRWMKPQIVVVGSGNAYANVHDDKWVPIEPPGIAYFAIYASREYDHDRRHPKVRKFVQDALEVRMARPSHEDTVARSRAGRAQFDPSEYLHRNGDEWFASGNQYTFATLPIGWYYYVGMSETLKKIDTEHARNMRTGELVIVPPMQKVKIGPPPGRVGRHLKWCVVWNTTTVGSPSRLEACYQRKTDAEDEARRLNRTTGMGGFYSVVRRETLARLGLARNTGDAPYGYDPRQRPRWTPDEAWEMFDQWWKRDGHWLYSSREQAAEMWRTNGIHNMPAYPGGPMRSNIGEKSRHTPKPWAVLQGDTILRTFTRRGDAQNYLDRLTIDGRPAAEVGVEVARFNKDAWWYDHKEPRRRTTRRRVRPNRSVVTRGKIELVERRLGRVINGDRAGAAGAIDEARSTLSDLESMPGDDHRAEKRLLREMIMEASSSMQPNRIPPIPSDERDIDAWDDWHRRTYAVGTPVKFLEDYQSKPDKTGAYDVVPKEARGVVSGEYKESYVTVTIKITDARDKIGYRIDDLIGREIEVSDHEIHEFLQPLEDNWARTARPVHHRDLPASQKVVRGKIPTWMTRPNTRRRVQSRRS